VISLSWFSVPGASVLPVPSSILIRVSTWIRFPISRTISRDTWIQAYAFLISYYCLQRSWADQFQLSYQKIVSLGLLKPAFRYPKPTPMPFNVQIPWKIRSTCLSTGSRQLSAVSRSGWIWMITLFTVCQWADFLGHRKLLLPSSWYIPNNHLLSNESAPKPSWKVNRSSYPVPVTSRIHGGLWSCLKVLNSTLQKIYRINSLIMCQFQPDSITHSRPMLGGRFSGNSIRCL